MTKYTECLIVQTLIKTVIAAADPVSQCKHVASAFLRNVFSDYCFLFMHVCSFLPFLLYNTFISFSSSSVGTSPFCFFSPKIKSVRFKDKRHLLDLEMFQSKWAVGLKSCYKEKTCGNLTDWIKCRQTTIYQHCNQWNMDMLFKRKIIYKITSLFHIKLV